jgi:hypothetical protein
MSESPNSDQADLASRSDRAELLARPPRSASAVASLALGVVGLVLTTIPSFVGLFAGGIPDLLAIVLGMAALTRGNAAGSRRGTAAAVVGLVLGTVGLCAISLGGGTRW